MSGKVVVLRPVANPTATSLGVHARNLAVNSANIMFDHPHFQQRMVERGLNMRQVMEVLRKGCVVSGPTQDLYGDWRIKLKRLVAGRRVQVVVAVKEDHLVVVTAI
jgi:hypothetical protein